MNHQVLFTLFCFPILIVSVLVQPLIFCLDYCSSLLTGLLATNLFPCSPSSLPCCGVTTLKQTWSCPFLSLQFFCWLPLEFSIKSRHLLCVPRPARTSLHALCLSLPCLSLSTYCDMFFPLSVWFPSVLPGFLWEAGLSWTVLSLDLCGSSHQLLSAYYAQSLFLAFYTHIPCLASKKVLKHIALVIIMMKEGHELASSMWS